VIDSQSVKTTESGGVSGYDARKKLRAENCYITVDTQGNLLSTAVHSASTQDRHGAPNVIADTMESFPTIERIYADGGYAGDQLNAAVLNTEASTTIEIVRRSSQVTGFIVIARRWIVERTSHGWGVAGGWQKIRKRQSCHQKAGY